MPASASVTKAASLNTKRAATTVCCLRAALLLVVAELLSGATYALRMINLDAPERVFLGDTIRLSCYYALQTTSGLERTAHMGARDLHSSIISGEQKSDSIQGQYVLGELFKSAPEFGSFEPTNKAFRRSPRLRLSDSKQVPRRGEPLLASSFGEQLYAVKWYKDGREFFRYLAQGSPKKQWLPMDGLMVDVSALINCCYLAVGQFNQDH